MLSLDALRRAVESHWSLTMTDLPTRLAGNRLAADHLPAWAELWLVPSESLTRRSRAADAIDLEIVVHLFVRPRETATTTETFADRIRAALEHRDLPFDGGHLRLGETTIKDLSRDDDDGLASRHLVLLIAGRGLQTA